MVIGYQYRYRRHHTTSSSAPNHRKGNHSKKVYRVDLERLLSDSRVELADTATVTRYVEDLRSLLSESSLGERRSFVRSFVKEVTVTDNEVLLTYTIPMAPKGITEEELGVPSIVHHGGEGGTRTPTPCGTWS